MGLVGTVVDAAIGWLVQSILGNLFTGQIEAWTRKVELAKDVENLKNEMESVGMVLAAAKGRRFDNEPLARKLDELKELLYDAEDVMDELDYYRLQQQIEEGKGSSAAAAAAAAAAANPEGHYVSSSTSSSTFQLVCSARDRVSSWASQDRKRKREEEDPIHRTMLSLENKHDISKRIDGIVNHLRIIGNSVKSALDLEISLLIATTKQSRSDVRNTRQTTSVPVECKVYGRDAERDMIIELLVNGNSSDLHVLPIVGSGGFGKTTLARFVYRDQRIRSHFDLHIWVCVSTNFNEVSLTREMLDHVCKDSKEYEKISNFNVLQEILLENIRNKRFLLVLDDMWEDKDKSGWDKLLAPLKHNQVTGCMVLATTRRNSVARMIGTMDAIKLNGLDEKEFWLFFKACTFGNENYESHPSLQSIGQQIAKALKGCPLAARSVGALLNRDVSYEHWRAVQDKWKSLQQEDDDILPILKLSYDYLPFHLQRCFSYCSLFPEDHLFKEEVLVQAWISQNFVQCEDTSKGLEETGRQYLNCLVDFGFFQRFLSHYAMHDLMYELAEQVSSNECAKINGLQCKTIQPCIRHLSVITTSHDNDEHANFPCENFKKKLQMIKTLQKLRTLMFFGRSSAHLLRSFLTMCEEAKTLRFLRVYATGADVGSILSILKPYHLRYIEFVCVSTTNILAYSTYNYTAFPQALTKFYHLQVLDVSIEGNLAVPTGMNNLVNLRHLIAHENVHSAIACVSNMTSLQELTFKVQNVCNFEIRQLQPMNQLVTLGISQLENVKNKEDASGASLIDKEHLEELSLSWDNNSMSLEPTTERTRDVLEGLEPHQNLKHLRITGYSGATSPTWLASNVSVTSLQTLHLENCREWRILGSLEMLPLLRKLTLVRMWNLIEVSIPSLEELVLIEMPKLEKCFGTYGVELTCHLRVLTVKNCSQLNEFTFFQSNSRFQAEQRSWFPSLTKLTIEHCPNIIKWEILPLEEMRALKKLKLMDMHGIRVLSVRSLKKLVLIKMSSLESCSGLTASPPLQFSPSQGEPNEWVSRLRTLTIRDCPNLIVSHPLPPSAMISELSIQGVPTFPTTEMIFRQLTIESNELNVPDDKILAFHNLRGITLLVILNCPNLVSLSSECFSQLTALETLRIEDCPNLVSLSFGCCRQLINLRALEIIKCGNLLSSYNISGDIHEDSRAQANCPLLPSLTRLEIQSCGIAGKWLTKMLPHVQSLEELYLQDCPQIKFISIYQPRQEEESSSLASSSECLAVATTCLAQDEYLLYIPSNVLLSLKKFSIRSCPELQFCGSKEGFGAFISLAELSILFCPKLLSSADERFSFPSSLIKLEIQHLPTKLQRYFLKNQTSLRQLEVEMSPNLESLRLESCTALEELVIRGCEQLAVLEGCVENVKNKEDASGASLIDKEHLEELSISWGNSSMNLEPTTERTTEVLEGLEPHQNLKHLRITGYSGATSPTWLASNVSVTSLQILHLENCREWRILGSLEMLPLLRKLTLVRMWNLTEVSIPSLEELVLIEMPKLEKCFGTYGVELTFHLRVLTVKNCSQLNEFTFFQSKSRFQAEQRSWFPSLTKLTIEHCPNIIKWEILPLEEMRALKELELMGVHGIRVLSVPSLEKLVLVEMSSLESCSGLTASPPLQFSPSQGEPNEWVSRLRTLTIRDCPNLIVSHPLPPSALISELSIQGVPTFPTMKMRWRHLTIESNELSVPDDKILAFHNLRGIISLGIQNCPNLVSLSSECFSQLTALKTLRIEDCPNLVSLSFGGFRQLINLRALEIIKCGNLLSSYNISGDIHEDTRAQANCPLLPSLTRIKIQSCGIAGKWLTKMLPHVQSLEELYLQDCPQIKFISIYQPRQEEESSSLASSSECLAVATTCLAQDEYIPSNVLLSLQKFSIRSCPELQFCGSKEGFGAFISLAELSILFCPKLLSSADERFSLPSSLIKLQIQHLPTKLQPYFPDNQTSLRQLEVEQSPNLESLRLESYTALEELKINGCEQLAVLEGLQFLCSLRILRMRTVGLKSLRLESCTALKELVIQGCKQLIVLKGLQNLSSLRSLGIEMNPELFAAWDRGSQEQNEGSDHARLIPPSVEELEIYDLREDILPCFLAQLPSLSRLEVRESPNLTSLQLGSCTALVKLTICDCESLNSLNSLQSLGNLTDLKVWNCPRVQIGGYELCHRLERVWMDDPSALTTSFCEHLTSLQCLNIWLSEVTRQLTDEQEEALQLLTSLRELQFWFCSNLVDLPAGLHSLPSLKRLMICGCKGISRLPEKGLPPSLERLAIASCSEELNAYCRMLATSKLEVTIDFEYVN